MFSVICFSLIISNFWRVICSSLTIAKLGSLQRVMTVVDATTVGNKMRERQGGSCVVLL